MYVYFIGFLFDLIWFFLLRLLPLGNFKIPQLISVLWIWYWIQIESVYSLGVLAMNWWINSVATAKKKKIREEKEEAKNNNKYPMGAPLDTSLFTIILNVASTFYVSSEWLKTLCVSWKSLAQNYYQKEGKMNTNWTVDCSADASIGAFVIYCGGIVRSARSHLVAFDKKSGTFV